jgi:hypothetical protein
LISFFIFIITRVNTEFLVLVAAPLGLYLILILYSLQDIEPSDAPATQAAAPASDIAPPPDTTARQEHPISATTVSQNQTTAEPLPNTAAPVAVTAAATQETFPTPTAPPPARSDEIASAIENAPVLEAEPFLAPAVAEQSIAAVVMDTATAPLPTIEAAAANETIIPEPVSVAVTEDSDAGETSEDEMPDGPLVLPDKGSPKFVFDYRGRLWVEKKHKGFFKQLRRPQLPPDDPNAR